MNRAGRIVYKKVHKMPNAAFAPEGKEKKLMITLWSEEYSYGVVDLV